jgi:hypothetical protein
MRPRSNVFEYDALEVAAGNAVVIKERVIAVVSQVLENGECPRNIGAAITEKNGFLDAFHTQTGFPNRRTESNNTRMARFSRAARQESGSNDAFLPRTLQLLEICGGPLIKWPTLSRTRINRAVVALRWRKLSTSPAARRVSCF